MEQIAFVEDVIDISHLKMHEISRKMIEQASHSIQNPTISAAHSENADITRKSTNKANIEDCKQLNDLKVISHTLNHCLSTQSQMANALAEIGKYLKQLSGSSQNPATSPQRRSITIPTMLSSPSSNLRFQKIKVKPTIDSAGLQSLLDKLEQIQKDVLSKVREYEEWQDLYGVQYPPHIGKATIEPTIKSHIEDLSIPMPTINSQIKPSELILSEEKAIEDRAITERLSHSISNIQLTNQEPFNDTSMLSKYDDIQCSESSQIINHNIPASDCAFLKPSKNFDRTPLSMGIFNNSNPTEFAPINTECNKEMTSACTFPTQGLTSTRSSSLKQNIVYLKKLRLNSSPIPIQDLVNPESNFLSCKVQEKVEKPRLYSNVRSVKNTNKTEIKSVGSFFINQEGKANLLESSKQGSMSIEAFNPSSPRGQTVGFHTQKNSPRLALNTLLQKEIIDETIENIQDRTMLVDKSMLAVDEGTLLQKSWMRYLNEEKVFEGFKGSAEDPQQIIAQKEKEVIKALMRDFYGDEKIYYHKGKLND